MRKQTQNIPVAEDLSSTSAAAIANAMKDLEGDVIALMRLSDLTSEVFDHTMYGVNRSTDKHSNIVITMTDHEMDQLAFLVNFVAERCSLFKRSFDAAYRGEVQQ